MRWRFAIPIGIGLVILAWWGIRTVGRPPIHDFGITGPQRPSVIAPAASADIADFDTGGPNRLGVLVTDVDADWLGLARAFKAHGIPARFTRDPASALRHDVVIAYPTISGRVLDGPAIRALAQHVRDGGTLLTFDLAGGGLEEMFGISGQTPSRSRQLIRWADSGAGDPLDARTHIGSPNAEARVGSLAITPTTARVVARYDDGSAAAVCREVGGRACILGIDPGSLAQRAMNGRSESFSPDFVNAYEPSLDVIVRWIRDLYVQGEDEPFLIGTAPSGRVASLILTHDVDYTRSVRNALDYAAMLRRHAVAATFFIQTKYVRDWNDDIFFDDAGVAMLKRFARDDEIASHSVAHARAFKDFPIGSGEERYPDYRPFVESRDAARGGSVLGELRVSKFLLDTLVGGSVRSFRPGHLALPEPLPEALAATGYRYSSALTANSALTHLPFRLTHQRAGRALVPVWEFPVTIEDEKRPRLGDRFDAAQAVLDRIGRHGGVAVVMIHPDVTGHKLRFEERLIAARKATWWIGSLGAFGDWWRARDLAEIDVAGGTITVRAPAAIRALDIVLPKAGGRRVRLDNVRGERTLTY